MYHLMKVRTTNLCAKFQIIRALHFSRIIIQIVKIWPKMKNAFHTNGAKKSIKYDFPFISKYISWLSLHIFQFYISQLIYVRKFKFYVLRLLNLSEVALTIRKNKNRKTIATYHQALSYDRVNQNFAAPLTSERPMNRYRLLHCDWSCNPFYVIHTVPLH
jgi:hypothetical protein